MGVRFSVLGARVGWGQGPVRANIYSFRVGSNNPSLLKGRLKKQRRGGVIKNWKSRYFVLFGGQLRYYEDAIPNHPYGDIEKGNMDLTGAFVEDKGGLQFFVIGKVGREKNLLLEADDAATKEQWMQVV